MVALNTSTFYDHAVVSVLRSVNQMFQERDPLLITGIRGTGKTTYGDKFAKEFGFLTRQICERFFFLCNLDAQVRIL